MGVNSDPLRPTAPVLLITNKNTKICAEAVPEAAIRRLDPPQAAVDILLQLQPQLARRQLLLALTAGVHTVYSRLHHWRHSRIMHINKCIREILNERDITAQNTNN